MAKLPTPVTPLQKWMPDEHRKHDHRALDRLHAADLHAGEQDLPRPRDLADRGEAG